LHSSSRRPTDRTTDDARQHRRPSERPVAVQSRSTTTQHTMLSISAYLAFYLLLITTAVHSLTTNQMHRLAQAASLSYLSMDKMPSSPYFTSCQLEPISQVVDPDSESGATIFWDRSNGSTLQRQLVVACRGSANPKNFGTNLKFKLVPATRLSQNYLPENALVHEGFQDASVGLWKVLGPKLFEILETTMRDEAGGGETTITLSNDIVFTGHSLGAATALLCSVHYNASRNKQQPIPQITSFGGPKLCNGVLARYLRNEALAGCNVVHLVHDKDPVLANNRKLWDSLGFEDVGVELQCDPSSPVLYVDEGDVPKSSLFGSFAWNIIDHCNYLGVFVGPRAF
jgi:hypothetical protein